MEHVKSEPEAALGPDARTGLWPIDRSQHEVLVVDDDPVSRYATVRLLRSAGFRTREAASGEEALRVADDSLSVLVVDVHLPDIDGFELCRRLRSRHETARLPVLHLSAAYVTDDDKVRGLDAGADSYLTHPVEPAVIVASVQALVRTRVAEEAMRRSEARFRAIYAQAADGICLIDHDGRIIDCNPAMLKLLKRDACAVIGHPVGEFVGRDWARRIDAGARAIDLIGAQREVPLVDGDGREVPVYWALSSHEEPGVCLAVVTDISQRVQLEKQRQALLEAERVARGVAERMNRMKDDFIAVLSHELRAPLNAIMGWTHVLKRRGGSDETMRGLAAIERNGQMQARMISDILDMSRLNTGKMPLTLERIDPLETVSTAINAMRASLRENRQELVLDTTPPYRPIRADDARLQQIVWNLLSNAIKFSPPGGRITVKLREENGGVRISVIDEGKGIDLHFLPFLFDRFTQAEVRSDQHRTGLGLGLSIVKQLAEAHGGTVAAASEGPGKGATVEVWLPADAEPVGPVIVAEPGDDGAEAETTGRSLEGLHLLVVDDDPEACAMLQIILADRGAHVKAAYDHDGALAVLDVLQPDAIVSDIGMPGKDGYELIREVRRREAGRNRHTPAIALTSFNRPQDQALAFSAGFDAHCAKPLRPIQLVKEISRLTSRRDSAG